MAMDQAYDDVLKVHENYNTIELSKPGHLVTRKDLITYELEKIQWAKKIELYQSYEYVAVFLTGVVII
jgi:hypothetical protein